jgi:hypothetical protein
MTAFYALSLGSRQKGVPSFQPVESLPSLEAGGKALALARGGQCSKAANSKQAPPSALLSAALPLELHDAQLICTINLMNGSPGSPGS